MESPAGGASSCHRWRPDRCRGRGSPAMKGCPSGQAWPPLASSSALEGKASEDVAQNTQGSQAISLTWPQPCLGPGVTGKVLALWQLQGVGCHISQAPHKACAQQVRLQNKLVGPSLLGSGTPFPSPPAVPLENGERSVALATLLISQASQPRIPPLPASAEITWLSHFSSPPPFFSLSPEAINCLMRAIEIYTDMVRVTRVLSPEPGPHIAPASPPSSSTKSKQRGAGDPGEFGTCTGLGWLGPHWLPTSLAAGSSLQHVSEAILVFICRS